jgi:SPFH domain / Band 7 family
MPAAAATAPGPATPSPVNPLQALASASTVKALAPAHAISERTQLLAQKVESVKRARLTCFEAFCSKGLGTLLTLPALGLSGLITVPVATTVAIFRFGKLCCVISQPGLHWVAPLYDRVQMFTGTQTHKIDELQLVDGVGNPILVRAILEFAVEDPAALFIATNASLTPLFNSAEQCVREACTRYPLLGERGHDIRSLTHELGASMLADLQTDASVFGVTVQRFAIVEARYSPQVASQMLMKQQATAMVDARHEIVAGALGVVSDTLKEFPDLSVAAKERLIGNLLVTLTSQPNTNEHSSASR